MEIAQNHENYISDTYPHSIYLLLEESGDAWGFAGVFIVALLRRPGLPRCMHAYMHALYH